jgi:type II secretory pathway pseudopilin PulG
MTGTALNRKPGKPDAGFTLVEIAISVVILGTALITLVGLNSRILQNYTDDRQQLRAALYAQYLMTMIEVDTKLPDIGDNEADLRSALEQRGYFRDATEQPNLDGWRVQTAVSAFDLPAIAVLPAVMDALREVRLTVHPPGGAAGFQLLYYAYNPSPKRESK